MLPHSKQAHNKNKTENKNNKNSRMAGWSPGEQPNLSQEAPKIGLGRCLSNTVA